MKIILMTYEEAMDVFQFESSKRILREANDFIRSPIRELEGKRFTKGDASNFHVGRSVEIDNQGHKVLQMSTYINLVHLIRSVK